VIRATKYETFALECGGCDYEYQHTELETGRTVRLSRGWYCPLCGVWNDLPKEVA
jgi:rubredoxin